MSHPKMITLLEVVAHIRKVRGCSDLAAKRELLRAIEQDKLPMSDKHKVIAIDGLRKEISRWQ